MKKKCLFVTALAMVAIGSANASIVVFDNFNGKTATNYTEETRDATGTFGTVLNSLQTQTINEIGLRWRANSDMNVTLGIYDSMLGGTYGGLNWTPTINTKLLSTTKFFAASNSALDYNLVFDNLDFTFQANHRYDIGIFGSTGTLLGSWDIQNGCGEVNASQNGFESINRNANINSSGSDAGYACVDPNIRLISNRGNDVPEPDSLALLGLGIAGLSIVRRKKSIAA